MSGAANTTAPGLPGAVVGLSALVAERGSVYQLVETNAPQWVKVVAPRVWLP